MRKQFLNLIQAVCGVAVLALGGCVKDTATRTYSYTIHEPVYKTTAEVRANIKSNTPVPLQAPGKLYIRGNYIFLNEIDKGIHIIDNGDPAKPVNVAFIDIPGNLDLAVKDNLLYADLYTDLVTIDISNPLSAKVVKVTDNVFPDRVYSNGFQQDPTRIIARWIQRDTTVTHKIDFNNRGRRDSQTSLLMTFSSLDASGLKAGSSSAPIGISGSMARFTIVNDRLYTVGERELTVFNISAPAPFQVSKKTVGQSIETIFPFKNKLFIGSATGMFIYDISNSSNPSLQGQFAHVRSCDPVIADDVNAYVTLRTGNRCRGTINVLEVLDITTLSSPRMVQSYPMTNPQGLSKDGTTLFLCDGKAGLKIYNASAPNNLILLKTLTGIETYDVIAYNDVALVVAKDGLYQYDYSNLENIRLLSKMGLVK